MIRSLLGAVGIALAAGLALATAGAAQTGTDIWVVPLIGSGESQRLGKPVPVTTRPGYDNQPSYSLDGRTL